jgi:hypothetical protein
VGRVEGLGLLGGGLLREGGFGDGWNDEGREESGVGVEAVGKRSFRSAIGGRQ